MLELILKFYVKLPFSEYRNPIFILGCGRSGTTILGRSLSNHPEISYLNEPRRLWSLCYPKCDIWSRTSNSVSGKMHMTKEDANEKSSKKFRRLFKLESIRKGCPVIVEKLPINNFRLSFIDSIFPEARYIHILRNGIEVASSIHKLCNKGWFGANDYKWEQLVTYLDSQCELSELKSLMPFSNFERGVIEWRLSTEAAIRFLENIPKESYRQITYNELTDKPVETIDNLLAFIGVSENQKVNEFARNMISRKTVKAELADLTDRARIIGGRLLMSTF